MFILNRMLSENFFSTIQKLAPPGIWSKGIKLSQSNCIVLEKSSEKDRTWEFKVKDIGLIAYNVFLSDKDQDWDCNCKEKNDVCIHVVACLLALRHSRIESQSVICTVRYVFYEKDSCLYLKRYLVQSGGSVEELKVPLTKLVAQSHNNANSQILVSSTDLMIDQVLSNASDNGILALDKIGTCTQVYFEENNCLQSVACTESPYRYSVTLKKHHQGFLIRLEKEKVKIFHNGYVLVNQSLYPLKKIQLSSDLKNILAHDYFFKLQDIDTIYPLLQEIQNKFEVKDEVNFFNSIQLVSPQLIFDVKTISNGHVEIKPFFEKVFSTDDHVILIEKTEERSFIEKTVLAPLGFALGKPKQMLESEGMQYLVSLEQKGYKHNGYIQKNLQSVVDIKFYHKQNSLDICFESNGKTISAESIAQAWRYKTGKVYLENGFFGVLSQEANDWLEKAFEKLYDLFEKNKKHINLSKQKIFEYSEILPASIPSIQDLQSFVSASSINLPKDFSGHLRDYQKIGVGFLTALKNFDCGGILADDMGLGKTLQILCTLKTTERSLIICPTSVLYNWVKELKKFRPALSFNIFHGNLRKWDTKANITITSYSIVRLHTDQFQQEVWDNIILDEAQIIKNFNSQTAQTIYLLNAKFKCALSGTPIENDIKDLWSQMHFVNPSILGTLDNLYEHSLEKIRAKVRPFILRRMKSEVLKELPPKTEIILYCPLEQEQEHIYEAIRISSQKRFTDIKNIKPFSILEQLLRLRQAACHSGLVVKDEMSSGKLSLLMQKLKESLVNGHSSIVFSQWTSFLDLISEKLKSENILFLRIDGSTQDRQEIVDQFQNASVPMILLASLKAGGIGLNLTKADHVYLMDPWWNPAIENQAIDRAYRFGQTKSVFVYRLISQNTVEEKMLNLLDSKKDLFDAIFQPGQWPDGFSQQDLLNLFEL